MNDDKTIKMTKQDFFFRLSQGEQYAWHDEVEPCEEVIDGILHCFGNDEYSIVMSRGENGNEYFSYMKIDHENEDVIDVELIDVSHN